MLVHFWIPTMQLSAFADTKVPLILNPWSCSEFNHLHDTKWFRGGSALGIQSELVAKTWTKLGEICMETTSSLPTSFVCWKTSSPMETSATFFRLLENRRRKMQTKPHPMQWCLVRASFGCKRTRIIHWCGAPLGLDLVFCTSLSSPTP